MKAFLKNYLRHLPFALGIIFTLKSILYILESQRGPRSEDAFIFAIIFGIIGIPLLVQSVIKSNLIK